MNSSDQQSLLTKTGDKRYIVFSLLLVFGLLLLVNPAAAATTSLYIEKVAGDGKTLLASKDLDAAWMEANLPVYGDGKTHYYHQGPVFIDDPDQAAEEKLRWNASEDTNVLEKDMGAVQGTAVKDLADLIGGMGPGDTITLRASDGFSKTFAYENVYLPPGRQGPMVITWYHEVDGYVPNYSTGMRLVFFADTSTNPWGIHAFGNWDWHESADPEYFYYYVQGGERYPTTTGLSVQQVSELIIHENSSTTEEPAPTSIPLLAGTAAIALFLLIIGRALETGRRNER